MVDVSSVHNDDFPELRMMNGVPFESITEVLHVVRESLHRLGMSSGTITSHNGAAKLRWIIGPENLNNLRDSGNRRW